MWVIPVARACEQRNYELLSRLHTWGICTISEEEYNCLEYGTYEDNLLCKFDNIYKAGNEIKMIHINRYLSKYSCNSVFFGCRSMQFMACRGKSGFKACFIIGDKACIYEQLKIANYTADELVIPYIKMSDNGMIPCFCNGIFSRLVLECGLEDVRNACFDFHTVRDKEEIYSFIREVL